MLTVDQLKNMKPDTIFASGETTDDPDGINMTGSGKELRWVACRGGIHDWAIYIQGSNWTDDMVKRMGDKVTSEANIRKLVPCDDEAFGWYRY